MAFLEARRHRWLESQFARRDLGDGATYDWYRKYWRTFIRYRHVEHLLGERQWDEFGKETFGLLLRAIETHRFMNEIVELYREGNENLAIVNWGLKHGLCRDAVYKCLLLINMNDARLDPRFH